MLLSATEHTVNHKPKGSLSLNPSQITQILLRLFAISWLFHGIVQTVVGFSFGKLGFAEPVLFLPGLIAFSLAVTAWFLAPVLGRVICRGNDQGGVISGITYQQLLQAMFVGIGLYFCASSLGPLLNGLHAMILLSATPESVPHGMSVSFYDFTKPALTFLAGALLVGTSRYWSRRISQASGSDPVGCESSSCS